MVLGRDLVTTELHAAPLRVGGVEKAYDDAFLVIGDAAGQVHTDTEHWCLSTHKRLSLFRLILLLSVASSTGCKARALPQKQ